MTTDTWHASDDLLRRFATHPAAVEAVTASSLEQHLLRCDRCRARVAADTEPAVLDDLWDEIADRVDRRAPGLVGRLLTTAGLDGGAIRLVTATGTLQCAALASLAALTLGSSWLAGQVDTSVPFLAVAPLVVLATVAAAFTPAAEPAGEVTPSTPLHGFGLLARRVAVVLAATVVPLGVGSSLLPGPGWEPFAWILPALALTLAALALATRYGAPAAAGAVGVAWLTTLTLLQLVHAQLVAPETILASPALQVASLAVAGCSLLVVLARRDAFDLQLTSPEGLLP